MLIRPSEYNTFLIDDNTTEAHIPDHLGGFNSDYRAPVLDKLEDQLRGKDIIVKTEYLVNQSIRDRYPKFDFKFSASMHNKVLDHFGGYTCHPPLSFDNFLCSFNGSPHVSRQILVSALHKFGLFNPGYCSKNFVITEDQVSGHVARYVSDDDRFYNKFLVSLDQDFNQRVYSFGHDRYNHSQNIYKLEDKLSSSFVHLVSETMAEAYHPFYGEKFLYSVVTRGLFVAYSQPGWHQLLEDCYGFKKYQRIFDYMFDTIKNPVERLLELITMLLKFRHLSCHDLSDLYQIESETIEYNYDHYFSGNYLKMLQQFE